MTDAPKPDPNALPFEQLMGTGLLACLKCACVIPHNAKAIEIHALWHKSHDTLIMPVGVPLPTNFRPN